MSRVSGDTWNGFGKYRWDSGNTYEGQWRDDKMHGTGTYTFADGGSWEGPWRAANPSGPGTWRFPGVGQVTGDGPEYNERAHQPAAPAKWRAAAAAAAPSLAADGVEVAGERTAEDLSLIHI